MSTEKQPISVPVSRGDGEAPAEGPTRDAEPRQDRRPPEPSAPKPIVQTPPIDIHEGPEGLVLEADLPGATEDSVAIQLEENVLSLLAEAIRPVPEGAKPLHEEFPIGVYQRSFILSDEVDRSRISAELKNGVLRLLLPKAERAQTRRIEINGRDA